LDSQKKENQFAGPVDPLKNRFPDITQVAFLNDQKAKMKSQSHSTPSKHRLL
jgi:hypothetical protein